MACGDPVLADVVEEYPDELLLSLILCRLDELRSAGCDDEDCVVLAVRLDLELDRAVDLIERGCPPDVALRILA